ncbi:bifunctional 2-C-methyl-D-erythritol 4-phosphate cytidylyltransferase/2-C-methyl-D-erythritol 2,4-cyclodiphosphate synthase [Alteraurantiacibacter aestuarii]
MLRHAADRLVAAGAELLCVVIPEGADAHAHAILEGAGPVLLVTGGETRQDSVRAGLEALQQASPDLVLIHDAARPDCPPQVVERLVAALADNPGAIPVLPVVDSMVTAHADLMGDKAARETLRRVQTPQAFRYADILAAHQAWEGPSTAGDDAQVAHAAGLAVALVDGDERLRKLTFADDFGQGASMIRTGTGFDVHRLGEGEELWLCGVRIPHDKGLVGHSDADVALHAVVDAILGAAGEGDIGQHFPPSDPQWRAAPSSRFVEHAVSLAAAKGYAIGNVDLAIICEAPKIGPHRDAMRGELARLLGVQADCVNVKATTTERLGFTGRGEGIAAQAVATLIALS